MARVVMAGPSFLDPRSPEAHQLSGLTWMMVVLGAAVFVVVSVLVLWALLGRARAVSATPVIVGGGVVAPSIILAVLAFATVSTTVAVTEPADADGLEVVVTGERWWWRVEYPGAQIETANEVHVPAGRQVAVTLRTADVIHSFWVPQLNGKVDMVPGHDNHLRFSADSPGVYEGVCAEFCGIQHARMRFRVVAHDPGEFAAWLAARQDPPAAASGLAAEGRQIFEAQPCAGCHTVRGTAATATVGPDLTDVGARATLGAGAVPNTPDNLAEWVTDAPSLKPGVLMPAIRLSPHERDAITAYLESLDP